MDYKDLSEQINNKTITRYLSLMSNTEFPPIFSAWSVIGCASAALSRHAWFDFAIEKIYPNMFIILTGTPGSRKSQSLNAVLGHLREATDNIRYAPNDTGGKIQGLITAITSPLSNHEQAKPSLDDLLDGATFSDFILEEGFPELEADRHFMFLANGELGTSLTGGGTELTRFLGVMFDGSPYDYQLKRSKSLLTNALMTLLGASTPEDLSKFMPLAATGQGFPSRVIFVYGERTRKVDWPQKTVGEFGFLHEAYKWMAEKAIGEFKMTPEARKLTGRIYNEQDVIIEDVRFTYYTERRHTHLIKLTMNLAALDMRMEITAQDVLSAHKLLTLTELSMSEALGDYGMAPNSRAAHDLLSYIKMSGAPVPIKTLWAIMKRDMMKVSIFEDALVDFENAGQIRRLEVQGIGQCCLAIKSIKPRKTKAAMDLADKMIIEGETKDSELLGLFGIE